jgi:hypothetical protein
MKNKTEIKFKFNSVNILIPFGWVILFCELTLCLLKAIEKTLDR